ncbi:MAG TPA: hypothetical protein DEH02_07530 [Bacteroidales bacterium]|nr:hypothetical protein [Bacteroidales bacterium]
MKKLLAVLAIMISTIAINAQCEYDTSLAVKTTIGIDGYLYSENASTTFDYGVADTAYFYLNPPKHWKLLRNEGDFIFVNISHINFRNSDGYYMIYGGNNDIKIDSNSVLSGSSGVLVNNTYELKLIYNNVSDSLYSGSVTMNFWGIINDPIHGIGNTLMGINVGESHYWDMYAGEAKIIINYTISNTTGIKITSVSTSFNNSSISLINNNLIVDYTLSKAESLPLYIFNTAGQLVYQNNISVNAGENHFENLVNLEKGMYVCRFGSLLRQKIIKF